MRKNILAVVFMITAISLLAAGVSADQASHLKAVKASKNTASVLLVNREPVRGLQFVVAGAKVTEIRTTKRTKGFLAKFNEKNGTVLVVSASAASIEPGSGSVLEIVCDKPAAVNLTNVKVVVVQKKK